MVTVVGIDPGLNGGICVLRAKSEQSVELLMCMAIPTKEIDGKTKIDILTLNNIIESFVSKFKGPDIAYIIEKVGAMPGQGVTSMFTFGEVYGTLKTFCALSNKKEPIEVTPLKWKNVVLKNYDFKQKIPQFKNDPKLTAKENKERKLEYDKLKAKAKKLSKDCSIQKCHDMFPDVILKATSRSKVDHDGIADAICIGLYGVHLAFDDKENKKVRR